MSTEPRTARRALNCLQNDSNGRTTGGLSNINTPNKLTSKQSFYETNEKLNKLKKRNSISLPDINLMMNNLSDCDSLNRSATSTPCKGMKNSQTSKSKGNISVILEEKENPSYMRAKLEKMKSMEMKIGHKLIATKAIAKKIAKPESREVSIQCNKSEEDMLFGDSVKGTDYWRLIAHKRFNAMLDTKAQNKELHAKVMSVNEHNEALRESIKELYELISQYKEIQKSFLEAEEELDGVEDSGYDVAN
jgi:hypothetical protein